MKQFIKVGFVFAVLGVVAAVLINPHRGVKAQSTYLIQTGTNSSYCSIGGNFGSQCEETIYWPTSFADSTYAVTCTPIGVDPQGGYGSGSSMSYDIVAPNTSTFRSASSTTIVLRTLIGGNNPYPQLTSVQCVGVHM